MALFSQIIGISEECRDRMMYAVGYDREPGRMDRNAKNGTPSMASQYIPNHKIFLPLIVEAKAEIADIRGAGSAIAAHVKSHGTFLNAVEKIDASQGTLEAGSPTVQSFNTAIQASREWLGKSGAINSGKWSHDDIRKQCAKAAVAMRHEPDSHETYGIIRDLQQTLLHADKYGVIVWLSEQGILDYEGREAVADLRNAIEGRLSRTNSEIARMMDAVVRYAPSPQRLLEQRRARTYELAMQGTPWKNITTMIAAEAVFRGWEAATRSLLQRDAVDYANTNALAKPPARYPARQSAR